MPRKISILLQHGSLAALIALLCASLADAAQMDASAGPDRSQRLGVQSGYQRPHSQHYSQGTSEGVHFRTDVPTYQHRTNSTVARVGPRGAYIATGQGVAISHSGRYYHRPYRNYAYSCPVRSYWVPGHWETVHKNVWIPGYWTNRLIPAVYRREVVNGREILVLVQEERWENVWVEGRYETRPESVWVAGYWARY
ncbi:MAG TPA: hypothetical protein PLD73_07675 [Candidatus Hydrogenedentes bacterium]|nr:hypothetical protein [Candidatus Hydrogenedentota bacterium]HPK00159.1 hypothetical protein [Candidatus Hydrogenedentota bacterium]